MDLQKTKIFVDYPIGLFYFLKAPYLTMTLDFIDGDSVYRKREGEIMNEKSSWEGKIIDAAGRSGVIKINSGENEDGFWEAELTDRKEGIKLQGKLRFTENKDGFTVKASVDSKEQGKFEWEAKLNNSDAGSYAQAVALGEYRSSTGQSGLLRHGVIVLWKFS